MLPPFERPDVVGPYEDWFRTPYGRLADRIEVSLILELLGPLGAGASLLEIGCGTGWFAREMAERHFRMTGIDASSAMVARARTRCPVVRGDAVRLPFVDRAFDGAYMIAVLDFVADPVAVLREARRVVRERVAVTALASGSWLALRRRIAARRGHPVFSSASFYSRHRLLDIAREAGAEPERVHGALVLPPAISARVPSVELALCGRRTLGAGIVGFSLPALDG